MDMEHTFGTPSEPQSLASTPTEGKRTAFCGMYSSCSFMLPETVVEQRKKIEKKLQSKYQQIEKKNRIVKALERLNAKDTERLLRQCDELRDEYVKLKQELQSSKNLTNKHDQSHLDTLKNEYTTYIHDSLCQGLGLRSFNPTKTLGKAIFFYLMRFEDPELHVRKIIHKMSAPLDSSSSVTYDWYELCCEVFECELSFKNFYKCLDKRPQLLEYFVYMKPRLMLNRFTGFWVSRLYDRLYPLFPTDFMPYDNLRQIIDEIRDEDGQTCLFYIQSPNSCISKLYLNHVLKLYKVLLIQNARGQTAHHVNTEWITTVLNQTYHMRFRDEFLQLTSITDTNNQTALEISEGDARARLSDLIDHAESNKFRFPVRVETTVLIIYNRNSQQATGDAQILFNACQTMFYEQDLILKENMPQDEMLKIIKQTALEGIAAFVVIFIGSGNSTSICDSEGKRVRLTLVEEAMSASQEFQRMSKLLITQCVQDETIPNDETEYDPTHQGFASLQCFIHELSGENFITRLARRMVKESKKGVHSGALALPLNSLVHEVERQMKSEKLYSQLPVTKGDWIGCIVLLYYERYRLYMGYETIDID